MTATLASPSGAGAYPSLDALIARAGGYEKITAAMWAEFDAEVGAWWHRYHRKDPKPGGKRK